MKQARGSVKMVTHYKLVFQFMAARLYISIPIGLSKIYLLLFFHAHVLWQNVAGEAKICLVHEK
jgi:hypothetical protein